MFTKIMKWICIAGLLLAVLWRPSQDYQVLLQFGVCGGALLGALHASRAGNYFWATAFAAIAVLFNPIAPFVFSITMFLWLDLICVATFAVSLAVLKPKPRLSSVR